MVRKKNPRQISSNYGQPVRFYKLVALSFLFITIVLLGLIVFMSAKRANITITTRPEPVDSNVSINVGENAVAPSIAGTVTSSLVVLEKKFEPKGVRQEVSTATGHVTLINDRSVDQPLVATTRLLTPEGVLFRLENRVLIPAKSSIQAEVYADKEGEISNIEATDFTIPGLSKSLQKLVYAKSDQPISGGVRYVGILSKKDLQQAEQAMLDDVKALAKTTLEENSQGQRFVFSLVQNTVESDTEIGVETDGFNLSAKATVVGVYYDIEELKKLAESVLAKQAVGSSEFVQVGEGEPTAILEDYDLEDETAVLAATFNGLVTIDANSKELDKLMFYGKTEDEVRRYVLSLDHVHGVDVSFRPLWNSTVPHVADHVNVVVRQVE